MLRYAIDQGVNYVDIGSPFILQDYEGISGIYQEALKSGYRKKVKTSATLPAMSVKTAGDFDKYLDKLLKWLGEDNIDFFLLGGLNRFTWPRLQGLDILKRAEKAITDKRIDKIGFYFHDHYLALRETIQSYDNWTVAKFQCSLMDIDHHPGVSGLGFAAESGLAVVVTKPLLGGRLTTKIPEPVAAIWKEATPKRSPAEWGLRWVWNHASVSTIACDMSSLEQVKQDIAIANDAKTASFTVPEELVISKVRDTYRSLRPIQCTACRCCMPCPQDIDAPRIFEIFNDGLMYNDIETARYLYRLEGHDIDKCNACGVCVRSCGKHIPLPGWLKKARKVLVE